MYNKTDAHLHKMQMHLKGLKLRQLKNIEEFKLKMIKAERNN